MAYVNANLSETQELGVYQPLPPGDYEVTIVNSEIRPSRKGEQQVVFIYEVSAGEHTGAQVFDRLSLWSTDTKTQTMAQRRLKSIAIACAHPNPNYVADTSEFHGRRMITRLALREYEGNTYQDVKAYMPLPAQSGAASAPRPGSPTPPPAPQPSEVHAMKPWE
ncbi:DUF669 domain-containing protein [Mailhella sp.]|uniref:DUF669 domain-containing protein n=1 Tax=Mailhella sp. TaxID=1981029 RepID=UPI003AB13D2D